MNNQGCGQRLRHALAVKLMRDLAGKFSVALGGLTAGNGWMMLCPTYDYSDANLSIPIGGEGNVLLKIEIQDKGGRHV